MTASSRLSTGVPGLDALLGGGLLPGTLTVVVGATGIGKTQLGVQFAHAGLAQEGHGGILFDVEARVDSQSHAAYAQRMFGWPLTAEPAYDEAQPQRVLDPYYRPGNYLHVFEQSGRRVTRSTEDFDHWHDWQAELQRKLHATIGFFFGNFSRGVRRAVVDGVEPVDNPAESIQFELFQYVYHQILRKDSQWVARDLLRQHYREYAAQAEALAYDHAQVACLLLATSHEAMLHELIRRPLVQGDLLSGANTLIHMGKVLEGQRMSRALFVAKHRGSACSDEITPYRIDDHGLHVG